MPPDHLFRITSTPVHPPPHPTLPSPFPPPGAPQDGVYDVTEWVEIHPGGAQRMMLAAGSAIDPFWAMYQQHNTAQVGAMYQLDSTAQVGWAE